MINLFPMSDKNKPSSHAPRRPAAGKAKVMTGPYPALVQAAALAPLLLLYEIAVFFAARPDAANPLDALLQHFLGRLGLAPYYLPGLLILLILLLIHLFRGDPWKVSPADVWKLWGESLLWLVPLVVMYLLFTTHWQDLSSRLSLADVHLGRLYSTVVYHLGVGLFEEFFFRLLLLSALLVLAQRLFSLPLGAAQILAICLSAAIFSAAHHFVGLAPYTPTIFLFRTAAGIYLGTIFVLRGFATSVLVHAAFNVFLAVLGT